MTRLVPLAAVAMAALLSLGPAGAQERKDFSTPPGGLGSYGFKVPTAPGGTGHAAVPRQGRAAADNFCLPPAWSDTRGAMALQTPGANPGTCFFKSEVKTRKCDCSTFEYRNVHSVAMSNNGSSSNFTPSNYEEAQNGSSCVSYKYRNVDNYYCVDGACYATVTSEAYCP